MPPPAAQHTSLYGVRALFQNSFVDRYWRNKRHNVQSFPLDGEYGDYLLSPRFSTTSTKWTKSQKSTKGPGVPVRLQVVRSKKISTAFDQVQCIARIIPWGKRRTTLLPGHSFSLEYLTDLLRSFETQGGFEIGVKSKLDPSVFEIVSKLRSSWKYTGNMPTKRRADEDCRWCLEVVVVARFTASAPVAVAVSVPVPKTMVCLSCSNSPAFELRSTRTLERLTMKYKKSAATRSTDVGIVDALTMEAATALMGVAQSKLRAPETITQNKKRKTV